MEGEIGKYTVQILTMWAQQHTCAVLALGELGQEQLKFESVLGARNVAQ